MRNINNSPVPGRTCGSIWPCRQSRTWCARSVAARRGRPAVVKVARDRRPSSRPQRAASPWGRAPLGGAPRPADPGSPRWPDSSLGAKPAPATPHRHAVVYRGDQLSTSDVSTEEDWPRVRNKGPVSRSNI